MSKVEKISVVLTHEQASIVRAARESGEYATNSEVIRDALRGWAHQREIRQQGRAELRRLVEEGLASGESEPMESMEIIKREARARFEERKRREGAKA